MVVSCVAYNCTERSYPGTDISFHRFPLKNPKLVALWIRALRRKNWKPTVHSRLCSKHFSEKDYLNKPVLKGGKMLRNNAVPLIFDFPPSIRKSASLFADIGNFHDDVEEFQRTKNVPIENVTSITSPSIEETPGRVRSVSSEIQIPSFQPVACTSPVRENADEESISVEDVASGIEVEEIPLFCETLQDVAGTLQNPVVERPEKTSFEAGKMPCITSLLAQKILDENHNLLLKNKQLERQLENYKKREVAWKKRRNVLNCRLQRREKIVEKLIAVVSTFEEDTQLDVEHASFTLKKKTNIPEQIS